MYNRIPNEKDNDTYIKKYDYINKITPCPECGSIECIGAINSPFVNYDKSCAFGKAIEKERKKDRLLGRRKGKRNSRKSKGKRNSRK